MHIEERTMWADDSLETAWPFPIEMTHQIKCFHFIYFAWLFFFSSSVSICLPLGFTQMNLIVHTHVLFIYLCNRQKHWTSIFNAKKSNLLVNDGDKLKKRFADSSVWFGSHLYMWAHDLNWLESTNIRYNYLPPVKTNL